MKRPSRVTYTLYLQDNYSGGQTRQVVTREIDLAVTSSDINRIAMYVYQSLTLDQKCQLVNMTVVHLATATSCVAAFTGFGDSGNGSVTVQNMLGDRSIYLGLGLVTEI